MGIVPANVANSPPGRRAQVCWLPTLADWQNPRHPGYSCQSKNKGCEFLMRGDLVLRASAVFNLERRKVVVGHSREVGHAAVGSRRLRANCPC